MLTRLTIREPDDWHLHLRDAATLQAVLPFSSGHFARAVIMPNLVPPVVCTSQARRYRQEILDSLPPGHTFDPLMTVYLTEQSDPADIVAGYQRGELVAVKLYPAGATTNSDSGVRSMENVYPVLEQMAAAGMPLCVHGEVTDPQIDIFDREARFIETVLEPLRERFPTLRIIFEHITTQQAVDYVRHSDANLAATITPHHLMINRSDIFSGGVRPHYYCLPVAKREKHRLSLRSAATSGDSRFFLGTDSAPHLDNTKENACGCAGIFCAPTTLACLAQVFEDENALSKLEAFTSINGPKFYGLPVNTAQITLVRRDTPLDAPVKITVGHGTVTVFSPPVALHWEVEQSV